MISAFGVDHGTVSKSRTGFVAQGAKGASHVWKPITQMTEAEKSSIRSAIGFRQQQRLGMLPGSGTRNKVAFGGSRNMTKEEWKRKDREHRLKRRFQGIVDER